MGTAGNPDRSSGSPLVTQLRGFRSQFGWQLLFELEIAGDRYLAALGTE